MKYNIIQLNFVSVDSSNVIWLWTADGSSVDWIGRRVGRIMIRMNESSVWIDECVFWMDRWMVLWLDRWMVFWIDGWMVFWIDGPRSIDEMMVEKDRWIERIFWKVWWIDVRKSVSMSWSSGVFDEWIDEWISGKDRWTDISEVQCRDCRRL